MQRNFWHGHGFKINQDNEYLSMSFLIDWGFKMFDMDENLR